MWFLLLLALGDDNYAAHTVHATQQECKQAQTSTQDECVAVTLNIIKLPPNNPITTTELPPIGTE